MSILFVEIAEAQTDKNEFFEDLQDKFGEIEAISCNFELISKANMSGKLIAVKGDKFRFESDYNIIVCDGEKIKNYDIEENKVVISDFEEGGVSLESFFFALFDEFEPFELREKKSSIDQAKYTELVLKPLDDAHIYSDFYSVSLSFDKSKNLKEVGVMFKGGGYQIWKLENLKINPEIKSGAFEFDPPEDAEVLDMSF